MTGSNVRAINTAESTCSSPAKSKAAAPCIDVCKQHRQAGRLAHAVCMQPCTVSIVISVFYSSIPSPPSLSILDIQGLQISS
jgi:hypothetical protein